MTAPSSTDPAERSGSEQISIPGLPDDWHLQATEKIVSTVDQVRVKTSGPAIGWARMAVFGILAAVLAIVALILLLIGVVRGLNILIPKDVWLVYLILGGVFTALGAFLWSRRPRGAAS